MKIHILNMKKTVGPKVRPAFPRSGLGRLRLLKIALLLLPAYVLAEDKVPSLTFLEFLGMSTELQEIGIEPGQSDLPHLDDGGDTAETKKDNNPDDDSSENNTPHSPSAATTLAKVEIPKEKLQKKSLFLRRSIHSGQQS
ncbi:hypothetical protein AB833_07625 [Chromatiales bacterium (ex Bugula neritina AB1)]|nr:hypothetical protein AB833_07625 [Chromatiales bacterium (ex Bugula neritina AB1)]